MQSSLHGSRRQCAPAGPARRAAREGGCAGNANAYPPAGRRRTRRPPRNSTPKAVSYTHLRAHET
eukprot:6906323-Lingulodinium_polyedra.AAC.1